MVFDRIKELREETGMSARKFAENIGIKYTTYYGYETGTREPGSDTVTKLCNYFGCTADYLLGLSDDPKGRRPKKENPSALAEAKTKEFTLEETDKLLVALGLIKEGEQLSDDDLAFLEGVITLLNAWFKRK